MGGTVCIMGVTAYLVNGFDVEEKICEISDSISRKDLTSPPDLIKFTQEKYKNIDFYRNSINSCISIQKYGCFQSDKEAYRQYYDSSDNIYMSLYQECLQAINGIYQVNLHDTDWSMLICVDEGTEPRCYIEKQNIFIVESLDFEKSTYFREFIDCSLIYQSVSRIVTFLKNLVLSDELTKFQQFQISYYSQELSKVKNPELFLTNRQEIEICKIIYTQWELGLQIENALSIADQAIANFSFLWDYRNASSQKFANIMLTLFTIIVGYPSLKDVVQEFIPNGMGVLKLCFLASIVVFLVKMIRLQYINYKEKTEFKRRRH